MKKLKMLGFAFVAMLVGTISTSALELDTIKDGTLSYTKEENETFSYYVAKIDLHSGGNYGYTFRVMPEHEMILRSENLDLVKWLEK